MELVVGMSRRGHPALPQGSFRNSRPLQLERKQPCFRALSYCLSACRAANEKSTRTMGDHNEHGRLATGQAGCPVLTRPDLVSFLVRDAGFEGDVSAGCSRGLYCTISASVRGIVANDGHHRIVRGPGLASWLVISVLRRMCFAVATEDRFLRMPRPGRGNAAGVLTVQHGLDWSWAWR